MSKPERRGVAWTEESGMSDEGRRRTERPEASGRLSTATDGSDSMLPDRASAVAQPVAVELAGLRGDMGAGR
jgi:hypothetical protein